jgi:DNA-binding PadR family transcriptional regulator
MTGRREPSLGEHAVLALLVEEPRHGWALVRELSPSGDIGRIWTLSRPLTYRAIENLTADGLIRATVNEPGEGARRTILAATPKGRRALDSWLHRPVRHLRDVRNELLLKLVLAQRLGRDTRPLIRAQQEVFEPMIAAHDKSAGKARADVVDLWRRESARAIGRFLAQLERASR